MTGHRRFNSQRKASLGRASHNQGATTEKACSCVATFWGAGLAFRGSPHVPLQAAEMQAAEARERPFPVVEPKLRHSCSLWPRQDLPVKQTAKGPPGSPRALAPLDEAGAEAWLPETEAAKSPIRQQEPTLQHRHTLECSPCVNWELLGR